MEIETKNGEVYTIKWRHERPLDSYRDKSMYGQISRKWSDIYKGGRTVAYIFDKDGNKIEAYANCSVRDTYNKKLGRKIAVGRLLKILELDTKMALRI